MNSLFKSKLLSQDELDRLVDNFDVADYSMRDSAEIQTVVALLNRSLPHLTLKIAQINRDSGSDALAARLDKIKDINKTLLGILSERFSPDETDDKSLVSLTFDSVNEVEGDGGTVIETEECVDSCLMFYNETTYSVNPYGSYVASTQRTLSEDDYLFELVTKLRELGFGNCVSFAKKRLCDFPEATATEIVLSNFNWHTISNAFTISKPKLNSSLKLYPEKRDELLSLHFIFVENEQKVKTPTAVQGSLFDDLDFHDVNVMVEGE